MTMTRISVKDFNKGVANGNINLNGRKGFTKKTLKKQKPLTQNKYPNYIPKGNLVTEKIGRATKYKWSTVPDNIFDSSGEAFIYLWLIELKHKGYIKSIELQPEAFELSPPIKRMYEKQLKTKTKLVEEHVESSQIYTPDFKIIWEQKAFDDNLVIDFNGTIKKEPHHIFTFGNESFVEAKPDSLDMSVSDEKNMIRLYKSKQKEVYNKYHIYINLIFHNRLFHETFMPARYTWTDKATKSKLIRYDYKTFDEFISSVKINKINALF